MYISANAAGGRRAGVGIAADVGGAADSGGGGDDGGGGGGGYQVRPTNCSTFTHKFFFLFFF